MAKRVVRPIRIEGNIAYVPLTKGYEAIIDAADVAEVAGFNWHTRISGKTAYATTNSAKCELGRQRPIWMHRVLMRAPDGAEVDHINGDGLDNRKSTNLRLATRAENVRNTRTRKTNTSGAKGVSWNKNERRWRAYITVGREQKHLGWFDDLQAAARAYAVASNLYHGEFGRT